MVRDLEEGIETLVTLPGAGQVEAEDTLNKAVLVDLEADRVTDPDVTGMILETGTNETPQGQDSMIDNDDHTLGQDHHCPEMEADGATPMQEGATRAPRVPVREVDPSLLDPAAGQGRGPRDHTLRILALDRGQGPFRPARDLEVLVRALEAIPGAPSGRRNQSGGARVRADRQPHHDDRLAYAIITRPQDVIFRRHIRIYHSATMSLQSPHQFPPHCITGQSMAVYKPQKGQRSKIPGASHGQKGSSIYHRTQNHHEAYSNPILLTTSTLTDILTDQAL
jgi:hypothetical protein